MSKEQAEYLKSCIQSWIIWLDDQEEYSLDELKLWGAMKEALKRVEELR